MECFTNKIKLTSNTEIKGNCSATSRVTVQDNTATVTNGDSSNSSRQKGYIKLNKYAKICSYDGLVI